MDIISSLSDDLLLEILLYVPTKDVVATSLLFKRWRSLWMLVPELEYNDSNHSGDYKRFSQFVYRSLLSNKAPVLEKLVLNLDPHCPAVDIRLWIEIAVSNRVVELKVDIPSSMEGSVSLPSSLYTSETLVILTLFNCILLDVPSSVCLPSLEIIHLEHIVYADNASLQSLLLSGSQNLENLHVEREDGDATMDATVVVQRLCMFDMYSGKGGQCVIDVNLTFCTKILYNFRQIENMPELLEARVCVAHEVTQKFLKAFTSVHRLSLWLSLSEVTISNQIKMEISNSMKCLEK